MANVKPPRSPARESLAQAIEVRRVAERAAAAAGAAQNRLNLVAAEAEGAVAAALDRVDQARAAEVEHAIAGTPGKPAASVVRARAAVTAAQDAAEVAQAAMQAHPSRLNSALEAHAAACAAVQEAAATVLAEDGALAGIAGDAAALLDEIVRTGLALAWCMRAGIAPGAEWPPQPEHDAIRRLRDRVTSLAVLGAGDAVTPRLEAALAALTEDPDAALPVALVRAA